MDICPTSRLQNFPNPANVSSSNMFPVSANTNDTYSAGVCVSDQLANITPYQQNVPMPVQQFQPCLFSPQTNATSPQINSINRVQHPTTHHFLTTPALYPYQYQHSPTNALAPLTAMPIRSNQMPQVTQIIGNIPTQANIPHQGLIRAISTLQPIAIVPFLGMNNQTTTVTTGQQQYNADMQGIQAVQIPIMSNQLQQPTIWHQSPSLAMTTTATNHTATQLSINTINTNYNQPQFHRPIYYSSPQAAIPIAPNPNQFGQLVPFPPSSPPNNNGPQINVPPPPFVLPTVRITPMPNGSPFKQPQPIQLSQINPPPKNILRIIDPNDRNRKALDLNSLKKGRNHKRYYHHDHMNSNSNSIDINSASPNLCHSGFGERWNNLFYKELQELKMNPAHAQGMALGQKKHFTKTKTHTTEWVNSKISLEVKKVPILVGIEAHRSSNSVNSNPSITAENYSGMQAGRNSTSGC